jgi:hypothetical protein
MFKRVAVTISAVAFVMLAIALAPNLPAALATARATITNDDVKLKQPTVQQSARLSRFGFLIQLAGTSASRNLRERSI